LKFFENLLGKMHPFDGSGGGHRREKPEPAFSGILEEWIGLGQGEVLHNMNILS
jgi:hypothetical protein